MENRSSRWLRVIAVMLSARFWTRSRSICVFPLTSFGQWCNFYYLIRQVRTAITFRLTFWHDEKTEQKNPVEKNKWLWFVRVSLKFNWRAKYETVLNLRNCEIPRTGTGEALSKARFVHICKIQCVTRELIGNRFQPMRIVDSWGIERPGLFTVIKSNGTFRGMYTFDAIFSR